jgi:hypothetical protein
VRLEKPDSPLIILIYRKEGFHKKEKIKYQEMAEAFQRSLRFLSAKTRLRRICDLT